MVFVCNLAAAYHVIMNDLTSTVFRHSKIVACFTISGVVSGLHPVISIFGVGGVFGCAVLYCLSEIDDNEDDRILMVPLVSGIIYLFAMFIPLLFLKIVPDIQRIDELSNKLAGADFNLNYVEKAIVGSVLLAGYLRYLGGDMLNVAVVALLGTLLSVFFFDYLKANNTLFDKVYPFIIWQITIGTLTVNALKREQNTTLEM